MIKMEFIGCKPSMCMEWYKHRHSIWKEFVIFKTFFSTFNILQFWKVFCDFFIYFGHVDMTIFVKMGFD